jgi:outer membrane protein
VKRIAVGCSTLVLTAMTMAGQAQPGKIGVINIQSAIVTTKDGQKAAAELQAKAAPRQKAMEAKQNEINSLKDQLQKGQNALSDQAKQELIRNIDVKTKSFNRDLEDSNAELDQEQQKVLQDLGGKMMAVIDKYAKDNGFVLIMDVSSPQTPILFASNTIEITKDIIELYDKNSANPAASSATPKPATPAPAPARPKPTTPPPGK